MIGARSASALVFRFQLKADDARGCEWSLFVEAVMKVYVPEVHPRDLRAGCARAALFWEGREALWDAILAHQQSGPKPKPKT